MDILHHSFVGWINDFNNNKCTKTEIAQHQYVTVIYLWLQCLPMSMGNNLEEICKYLSVIFKHSFRFFSYTENEEEML